MKKKDIYELLDKEIAWCEKHRSKNGTQVQNAFIRGLYQAKKLIKLATNL